MDYIEKNVAYIPILSYTERLKIAMFKKGGLRGPSLNGSFAGIPEERL